MALNPQAINPEGQGCRILNKAFYTCGMKKFLILFIGLSLFAPQQIASAAIKTGDVCKTKGQVKVSGNREFTCIKKGTKFVWSKAKIIGQAQNTKSTPIPTISSTPTGSRSSVKYAFTKIELDSNTFKFGGVLSLSFNLATNDPDPKVPYCLLDMVINPFEATLINGSKSSGDWSCSTSIPAKPMETNPSGTYGLQILAISSSDGEKIEERQDVAVLKAATGSDSEVAKPVSPGAFCSPEGAIGKNAKGVQYTCKASSTDSRNRWRL